MGVIKRRTPATRRATIAIGRATDLSFDIVADNIWWHTPVLIGGLGSALEATLKRGQYKAPHPPQTDFL